MRRSKSKQTHDQKRDSATATVPPDAESQMPDDWNDEPAPVKDVVVRLNNSLLIWSAAIVVVCVLAVYFGRGFQVRKNAAYIREKAQQAETEGNSDEAQKFWSQYLTFQRSQSVSDAELIETLDRLATLSRNESEETNVPRELLRNLERAYFYYEEILRLAPDRHEDRRHLVDVCVNLGQFPGPMASSRNRDAVEHVAYLMENDRDRTKSDSDVLRNLARAQFALKDFRGTQKTYARLIQLNPGDHQSYIRLSEALIAEPRALCTQEEIVKPDQGRTDSQLAVPNEDEDTQVVTAFPLSIADRNRASESAAALRVVDNLLRMLVTDNRPGAHRVRADLLISIPSQFDAPGLEPEAAAARVKEVFSADFEADLNGDGLLTAEERDKADVPAFSVPPGNTVTGKDELLAVLTEGGQTARLNQAEWSVDEMLRVIETIEDDEERAECYRTAARVYQARATAAQYSAIKTQKDYSQLAREAAQEAVSLSKDSPESMLTLARLEVSLAQLEADPETRNSHYAAAEDLLRRLRASVEGSESFEGLDDATKEQLRTLADLELSMLLVDRLQTLSGEEAKSVDTELEALSSTFAEHSSLAHIARYIDGAREFSNQKWRVAETFLRSAAAELRNNDALERRIGILRAECARRLEDLELHVTRALALRQSDLNWGFGRVLLAQAYATAKDVDAAVNELAPLHSDPLVTPQFARLLLQRELRKPPQQRNWKPLEDLLRDKLQAQPENAAQYAILQSELLYWKAVGAQIAHQAAGHQDLAPPAVALLQEAYDTLATAVEKSPKDVDLQAALCQMALRRFDQPNEQKAANCDGLLRAANNLIGDHVKLWVIAAQATSLLPKPKSLAALSDLKKRANFNNDDRATLLASIAAVEVHHDELNAAIENLVEAAKLRPTDLSLPQSGLQLIVASLADKRGDLGAHKPHWDELLAIVLGIEGENGPIASYYKGAHIVLTAQAEKEQATDLDEAQTLLSQARRARPQWAAVPRMLGALALLQHADAQRKGEVSRHRETAIEHFEDAIALGDYSEAVVQQVAEYYINQNREADAQKLLADAAQRQPQAFSGKLATLAWVVEQRLGERVPALDKYIASSETANGKAEDKIRAALMLISRNESGPKVEELLREACELEPTLPGPWVQLVNYLASRDRIDEAVSEIDEAAQVLKNDPPELKPRSLAHCYQLLRRKDSPNAEKWGELAERQFAAAIDAAPRNISLQQDLIGYYLEAGQIEKARIAVDKILDPASGVSEPSRKWAQHIKASVLASSGTIEDSNRALEMLRSVKLDTDDQRIFNLRSQLDILAKRNRVTDRPEMQKILEQIQQIAGPRMSLQERLQLAALYEAAQNWTLAEAEYEKLVKVNPEQPGPPNASASASYALALLRQKWPLSEQRLERLNSLIETLKASAPNSLETAIVQARLLHLQGQSEEAVPILLGYLETLNHRPPDEALRELIEQKNVDGAVELLKAALRARDDQALAQIVPHLEDQLRQQKTDEALQVVERYLSMSEFIVDVQTEMLRVIGNLVEEFGQLEAAQDLYTRYVEKSRKPAEATLTMIGFLARQDRIDEALDKCQEIWNKLEDPTKAADTSVAIVRHRKATEEQTARVEELLAKGIEQTTNPQLRVQYQIYIADLRDVQQKTADAIRIYEAILRVNDRHVVALNNLAWLLSFDPAQRAQALSLINRAIEVAGPLPAFRDTRAVILTQQGKPEQAVEDLTEAIAEAGDDPALWFHMAEAHLKAGDRLQAKRAFQNAQEKGLKPEALHRLEHASYHSMKKDFGGSANVVDR